MIRQARSLAAWISLSGLILVGYAQPTQVSNTIGSPPSAVKATPESSIGKNTTAKRKTVAVVNVAASKRVIARAGGITYPAWGNANDSVDYRTTTNYPQPRRWGNETNNGNGTVQVVDLGAVCVLNKVGYNIDWDGAFKNSLTFRVEVSTNNKNWQLASQIVHPYSGTSGSNKLNVDIAIQPIAARYVKYWEPPDGSWNG